MGNGVSIDQGNLPSYGTRDVSDAADWKQHDWSQLAEAPITEQPSFALSSPRNRYTPMLKIPTAKPVFSRSHFSMVLIVMSPEVGM